MNELVFFNIRRHYSNKLTILINVVIFIAMFFVFNMDLFLKVNDNVTIYCDNTTRQIYQDLQEIETLNTYSFSNKQQDFILHYDERFMLICKKQLSTEQIETIQKDLNTIIKQEYIDDHPFLKEYFSEYDQLEIRVVSKNSNELIVIVSTIVYFLIVNYSSCIASEVVYEKSTSILDTILTNVSAKEHLLSKIIIGYLSPLIQILIIIVEIFLNYLIRYNIDKFEGFQSLMMGYMGSDITAISTISLFSIIEIVILVISGLLVIQIILLFLVSGFTNSEQATSLLGFIQVLMLIIYYTWIMLLDSSMIDYTIVKILSFVPILSTLIAPCRIIMNSCSLIEILIVFISNIVLIAIILKKSENVYKTNLMKK